MQRHHFLTVALGASLLLASGTSAAASDEERSLNALRNTVVNLLQGLVDRGVITREQAAKMVSDAQSKAEVDAAATAAQDAAEADAVRVPYVPQVVKDEIRRQVAADLGQQVTKEVVEAAQSEGWGVPSALPDWVKRMRWYGDVRLRGQGDFYAADNIPNVYLDYQRINEAGGITKAGLGAYLNTDEQRERMRERFRLGFETVLGYGWTTGARITTGSLRDPVSTNQTLGNSGFRQQLGLDLAYIDYTRPSSSGRHSFSITGGRIRNPFFVATDLVYDQDLTFDGVAANARYGLDRRDSSGRYAYATVGAFPLQEVELSARDKWLFGGQLGMDWKLEDSSRLRAAASYYYYRNITGQANVLDSNLLDFTAPQYLRLGNSLFDIRLDADQSTNLFALAAEYQLVNYSLSFEKRLGATLKATIAGDYVQNIGYDAAEVQARMGFPIQRRNVGYQAEVGIGSVTMASANAWRAVLGYRHVQRDAVLDAFTDSDFRLGGTDAKGYYFGFDYSVTPLVMGRIKYMSGRAIDGPPLGIDVLQIDLTASF